MRLNKIMIGKVSEKEKTSRYMNAINELSTFVSWKVRIVSKLENKTFRISTANPAVITDSILRDIQIRQCPLVASQSKIYFLSIFNKVGLYTIEINHDISNC